METTIRKRSGKATVYNRLAFFRCSGCGGHADVIKGRIRVIHSFDCKIYKRLLSYPRFYATLELYREMPS